MALLWKVVKLFFLFSIALCPLSCAQDEEVSEDVPSKVVVLTEKTFEHETQASTGATTGDWFIEFYAPWCGHCKRLTPIWEELAQELEGSNVIIAKVDGTQNRNLLKRFSVRGFPTLKFFHHGEVYTYKGSRSKEKLLEFVQGGYKDAEKEPVPGEPTFFGELVKLAKRVVKEIRTNLTEGTAKLVQEVKLGLQGDKRGRRGLLVVGGIFCSVLFMIGLIVITSSSATRPKRARKKDESKND